MNHHERRLRDAMADPDPEAMVERIGAPDVERATWAAGESLGYALELAGTSEAFATGFLDGTRKAAAEKNGTVPTPAEEAEATVQAERLGKQEDT